MKKLLNDLLLFANAENDDNEYCLQPIVLQKISKESYLHVAKEDDSVIRVVDGQQRLTTLAIILKKLSIPTTWDIYYDSEKKNLFLRIKTVTRFSALQCPMDTFSFWVIIVIIRSTLVSGDLYPKTILWERQCLCSFRLTKIKIYLTEVFVGTAYSKMPTPTNKCRRTS